MRPSLRPIARSGRTGPSGWAFGIGLPAGLLAAFVAAYAGQRSFIYRAVDFVAEPSLWQAGDLSVVRYRTADGLELAGWYAPPGDPAKPTILYFSGREGHLGLQAAKLRRFLDEGYGVMMAGYRGYAGNPGRPSELGLHTDAAAAAAFLAAQGIAADRTLVWGYSLGTAMATRVAAAARFAGLVLEAPFESIPAVVQAHARWTFGPLIWDRFNTRAVIAEVASPILILHGSHDRVIPWTHGVALSRAAGDRAELVLLPGAGHGDTQDFGALDHVADFLGRVAPTTPSAEPDTIWAERDTEVAS
ncbi:MAG TPA: alpha/beta hydrolase [Azospirillaceae bacterium]|nr:alpha/beta hydrolase [Azospirillaceae bacterium]